MSVIVASDLTKSFEETTAVNSIDLTIGKGDVFGFLGPNGAGKTTTINILTGQTTPDTGTVSVLGMNPVTEPVQVREVLGILPERESPPSFLTPREYFEFVGDVRNIPENTVETRIREWADKLDITDHLNTINHDLSRGQQQKVMLTQAFLAEPEIVIIDEPLVNLDPLAQELIKDELVEYANDDRTIILSTHDIGTAVDVCNRVAVMQNGEIVGKRDLDGGVTRDELLGLFKQSISEGQDDVVENI